VNLLVAGRDTVSPKNILFRMPQPLIFHRHLQTGSLLTFAFYMLTQHPDIERRLREEIFEKVGPEGNPTYEHMRDMKFTRAFLNGIVFTVYIFLTLY
jgi:hypothetical protein